MLAPPKGNMSDVYNEFWRMQDVIENAERYIQEETRLTASMEALLPAGAVGGWFLVFTHPGFDMRALRWLARRRFAAFRPMQPKEGGGGEATLSGVLLVYTWDIEKNYSRILATPGVKDVFHDPVSLKPIPIDNGFAQQLRAKAWQIEPKRLPVKVPNNPQKISKPRRPSAREHKALDALKKTMKQKGIVLNPEQNEFVNKLEPRMRIAILNRTIAAALVSLPAVA